MVRRESRQQLNLPAPSTRSISIIGAGRVGTALGIALSRSGYEVKLVVTRRAGHARRAARLIHRGTVGLSASELRRLSPNTRGLLTQSSVIVIATPDDEIATVAVEIATGLKRKGFSGRPKVALHTSGALPAKVLEPMRPLGFSVGSFHPLISISDSKTGAEWLTRAFFSVEGDAAAVRAAKRMARDLGGRAFVVTRDAKALYHAAALMSSPNLTALIDISLEMLSRCGLTANQSRKVLLPLIRSTLDNLETQNPSQALTGTFKRGDVATVRRHLEAISNEGLFDALEAYVLLGRRSLKLANPNFETRRTEIAHLLARALKNTSQ